MNNRTASLSMGVIGIFLLLAGEFDLLKNDIVTIGGVAFLTLAGIAWVYWPGAADQTGMDYTIHL